MRTIITEPDFRKRFIAQLGAFACDWGPFGCVTGPGRSGAIAAVYASHFLSIPFIPYGVDIPDKLLPVLVVDTARKTGKTIRKACRQADTPFHVVAFAEPPRVKFWYEASSDRNVWGEADGRGCNGDEPDEPEEGGQI